MRLNDPLDCPALARMGQPHILFKNWALQASMARFYSSTSVKFYRHLRGTVVFGLSARLAKEFNSWRIVSLHFPVP